MSEENKAVARRFYEIWMEGDLDALDEVVAPDTVDHDPYNPHGQEGLEGAKKTIAMYREAFPDTHFEIEDQIAAGDKVVTRWTATGTHEGELMGVQPTGKKATVAGITIDRIEDGKIAEGWTSWDTLAMMQSIGAIPEQEPAAAQS
jgi:steroid delta-isomerase-like uncharacterized protein